MTPLWYGLYLPRVTLDRLRRLLADVPCVRCGVAYRHHDRADHLFIDHHEAPDASDRN